MMCSKCFLTNPCDRLRILRVYLNITYKTFSRFMGISSASLYIWEHRGIRFSSKQKERLRYVGINPQWVDYGTGDPFLINDKVVAKNIIDAAKL